MNVGRNGCCGWKIGGWDGKTDVQGRIRENMVNMSNCFITTFRTLASTELPPRPLYADAGVAPAGDPAVSVTASRIGSSASAGAAAPTAGPSAFLASITRWVRILFSRSSRLTAAALAAAAVSAALASFFSALLAACFAAFDLLAAARQGCGRDRLGFDGPLRIVV